jgi:hypothetical protein
MCYDESCKSFRYVLMNKEIIFPSFSSVTVTTVTSTMSCCELPPNVQTRHSILLTDKGTQWRRWLRHCATSRKVAGSIPDGVTEIFHRHNPPVRTVARASTHECKGYILGVMAAGAWVWQPCLEIFRARRACIGSKMARMSRAYVEQNTYTIVFWLCIYLFIYLLSWVTSTVIVKL